MIYRLAWLLLLVGSTAGCRDRHADQLLGRWIGQPDTAAARGARETLRYQNLTGRQKPSVPLERDDQRVESDKLADTQRGSPREAQVSDWERYDVQIVLEFIRTGRVNMSLADGSEPQWGVWHVVQQTPVGLVIEIETRESGQEKDQGVSASDRIRSQRRRFELQFETDPGVVGSGRWVGFRLVEVGADPRLGALYFKREKSS